MAIVLQHPLPPHIRKYLVERIEHAAGVVLTEHDAAELSVTELTRMMDQLAYKAWVRVKLAMLANEPVVSHVHDVQRPRTWWDGLLLRLAEAAVARDCPELASWLGERVTWEEIPVRLHQFLCPHHKMRWPHHVHEVWIATGEVPKMWPLDLGPESA